MRTSIGFVLALTLCNFGRADVVIDSSFANLSTGSTGSVVTKTSGAYTNTATGFSFTTGPEAASYLAQWKLNSLTIGLSTKNLGLGQWDTYSGNVSAYLYRVNSLPNTAGSLTYLSNLSSNPTHVSIDGTSLVNYVNINLSGLGDSTIDNHLLANQSYFIGLNFTQNSLGTASSYLVWDQSNNAATNPVGTQGWVANSSYLTPNSLFSNTTSKMTGATSKPLAYDLDATAVPEAAPIILFGAGLAVMAGISFFRRKKSSGLASVKP